MNTDRRFSLVPPPGPVNRSTRRPPFPWVCWSALGLLLFASGCGPGHVRPTELSPKERAVQIYENGASPNCTLFEDYGSITVESGSTFTPGNLESSKAKLQRAAAELGATSVKLTSQSMLGKIHRATGVAIKCIKRD